MRSDLSIVAIAENEGKARAMASILKNASIEVVISKDTMLPVLSDLSVPFHGLYVLVPRDRLEDAKGALIDTETQTDNSKCLHDSKNVIFRCTHCKKVAFFRIEKAGNVETCPHCKGELTVPEP
ncbi:MAG: hypothetical protein ACYTFG_06145 [Planctomycetota bacterium]